MLSKFYRWFGKAVAIGWLLCGVCGCQTVVDFLNSQEGKRPSELEEPTAVATYFEGPKVRPGIALAISVTAMGATDRDSKQYMVDTDGCISMELVGQIQCNGLTLVELQKKIEEAYKEYFREPSCSATFIYQPGQSMVSPWGTVTVLGEVLRPGPVDVPATQDLRVTRALQLAGGVTSIADKRRVKVTRCDKDGIQSKRVVNLVEIGEEGRPEKDLLLKAGDVIWVPMSWY